MRQSHTVRLSRMRLCNTPSTQALATKPHATKSQAARDKAARLLTQARLCSRRLCGHWTAVRLCRMTQYCASHTVRLCVDKANPVPNSTNLTDPKSTNPNPKLFLTLTLTLTLNTKS